MRIETVRTITILTMKKEIILFGIILTMTTSFVACNDDEEEIGGVVWEESSSNFFLNYWNAGNSGGDSFFLMKDGTCRVWFLNSLTFEDGTWTYNDNSKQLVLHTEQFSHTYTVRSVTQKYLVVEEENNVYGLVSTCTRQATPFGGTIWLFDPEYKDLFLGKWKDDVLGTVMTVTKNEIRKEYNDGKMETYKYVIERNEYGINMKAYMKGAESEGEISFIIGITGNMVHMLNYQTLFNEVYYRYY